MSATRAVKAYDGANGATLSVGVVPATTFTLTSPGKLSKRLQAQMDRCELAYLQ